MLRMVNVLLKYRVPYTVWGFCCWLQEFCIFLYVFLLLCWNIFLTSELSWNSSGGYNTLVSVGHMYLLTLMFYFIPTCMYMPFYIRRGNQYRNRNLCYHLEPVHATTVKSNPLSLRGKQSKIVRTLSSLGKKIRKTPSWSYLHLTFGNISKTILFSLRAQEGSKWESALYCEEFHVILLLLSFLLIQVQD